MKSYVIVTGIIFGLLVVMHVWRMVEERHLGSDPGYLVITAVAAALSVWAWRLARGGRA
jgi:hypothetical protein